MNEKYKNECEFIRRESTAKPELCMVCGKCSGACPSFDIMEHHPHQFAKMILRGELDALRSDDTLYLCMSCFTCSERCPRGVEPAALVEAVRNLRTRQKGENHMTPENLTERLSPDLPTQALVSAMRKYSKGI